MCRLAVFVCAILFQRAVCALGANAQSEAKLAADLLSNYNKRIAPSYVNVSIELGMPKFIELDREKEILTIDTRLDLSWYDDRLMWDPASYDNTSYFVLPPTDVWLPDIDLYNSAGGYTSGFNQEVRVALLPTGQVYYVVPMAMKSYCAVEAGSCDHHDVTCSLKLASWVYDLTRLDIYSIHGWSDLVLEGTHSRHWRTKGTSYERNVEKFDCCPNPFPVMTFSITLEPVF